MKLKSRTRSVLLGTAAGLATVAGAQAADLPVKARPVQYVKICTLYGDGYYYIPGSDTCIKIGGYTEADGAWNASGARTPAYSGTQGAQDRTVSLWSTRYRATLNLDTRTQTQYGTLRTLANFQMSNENQSESFNLTRGFLQWAGFTFGRMQSFSDTWSMGAPWSLEQGQTQSDTGANGVNSLAYTFELGNGITLTAAADERRTKALTNLSVNSALKIGSEPTDYHGGESYPDPYLTLRTDQPWAFAALSAGIHNVNATDYTQSGTSASLATTGLPGYSCTAAGFAGGVGAANTPLSSCGHPSDKVGWFIMAGGEVKLPMLGAQDRVGAGARYSVGATGFGAGSVLASPALFSAGNSFGTGMMTDGVFVNGSGIELTTGWGVQSGYEHSWTPNLKTNWGVSYGAVQYDSQAATYISGALCGVAGTGAATQTGWTITKGSCSPNWSLLELTSRTTYYPLGPEANLLFVFQVAYVDVFTGFNGATVALNTPPGARPAGIYSIGNEGIWSFYWRARRDFSAGAE